MTKKQEKLICDWLDDQFDMALFIDKKMGNGDSKDFLQNNPNYIYYKGALKMVELMGYAWEHKKGKHIIYKGGE